MARPEGFEPPPPRFVVWGKTIGLIEERSHNNWCLKLLHDLRHESVATFGSISYFGNTSRKLVLNTRSGLHRQQLGMPTRYSQITECAGTRSTWNFVPAAILSSYFSRLNTAYNSIAMSA